MQTLPAYSTPVTPAAPVKRFNQQWSAAYLELDRLVKLVESKAGHDVI